MRLAAPAFRAGVQIEHVLPREVLECACSKVLIRLILGIHHGVDVEGAQRSLGSLVLEQDVGNRGDDVQMLAVAEIHEESKDKGEVRPEEQAVEDGQRLAPRAERPEDARQG